MEHKFMNNKMQGTVCAVSYMVLTPLGIIKPSNVFTEQQAQLN